MKCNVGKKDKIVRSSIAGAILLTGVLTGSWWGLLGLVALVPVAVGYCPLYPLLGVDTTKGDAAAKSDSQAA